MQFWGGCQLDNMAGWAGFSDAELKKMKQTSSTGPSPRQPSNKQAMAKKPKTQQQREFALQRAQDFAQCQGKVTPLSQQLSQSSIEHNLPQEKPKSESEITSSSASSDIAISSKVVKDGNEASVFSANVDAISNGTAGDAKDLKELDEQEALSVELSRIQIFQRQQQKIEEENKQRRRVLADAIKKRSKIAKEEAVKLTKVQKELSHLDSLVTADVSIIRDRIEAASIDFLQAQKRYERAEKEFVEAKMALAEKSDLKESLTEHLYTVIQQNEIRKAERLALLMKELGLAGEDCPIPLTVPPLLSFSPINTLHRPNCPPTPTSVSPQTTMQSSLTKESQEELSQVTAGVVCQGQDINLCNEKEIFLRAEASHTKETIRNEECIESVDCITFKETDRDQINNNSAVIETVQRREEYAPDCVNPDSRDSGADSQNLKSLCNQ